MPQHPPSRYSRSFSPGMDERISFETLQGPDITVAGGRLGQAEHLRGFVVGQVLEVPQGQDFAVDRVHAVERLLDDQLVLGADGGLAGAGHLAQELGGQRDRVAWGNGPRCSETSWPASRIWAPRWYRCTSVSRWPAISRSQR